MSLQIRLKNSGVQGKEPLAADLAYSELAINWNAAEPFLAIKDSNNTIRRIAGVRVGPIPPSTPSTGECWLDTAIEDQFIFKIWDGTAWRSVTVNSSQIADGSIVDADVNTSAAIAHSKLASLSAGNVLLGNASNVPTSTPISGDVTISSTGVTAIKSNVALAGSPTTTTQTAGTNDTTLATTAFVSAAVGTALPKAGGTMTGAITLAADPSQPLQPATKQYVDTADATLQATITSVGATATSANTTANAALPKAGGTMTGPITFAAGQTFPGAGSNANYQEFNSSGTWTKPSGVGTVYVEVTGGGGSGGSGARLPTTSTRTGGGGGGSGITMFKYFRASDLAATVSITIGAGASSGGAAVTTDGTNGNAGTAGGDSSFGTYLVGIGGAGGLGGSTGTASGGGVIVTSPQNQRGVTSFTHAPGLNGGATTYGLSSNSFYSGGGGGGNGRAANNTTPSTGGPGGLSHLLATVWTAIAAGTNAPANEGGGGGGGSYTTATAGMAGGNGASPGGGGGGGSASDNGYASGAGGSGGSGLVRVWSW